MSRLLCQCGCFAEDHRRPRWLWRWLYAPVACRGSVTSPFLPGVARRCECRGYLSLGRRA